MRIQRQKLDIDKWFEGQRISRDPGTEYILEWIEQNATLYRKTYELSLCKRCKLWKTCGYKLRMLCSRVQIEK